jgi:Tfp pilus assembly major pilin PilA
MELESTTCSYVVIPYYQSYQQRGQVVTGTEVNIGVVIVGSWTMKENLLKLKSSECKIAGRTP